jgi:hypothetical protein
MLKQDMAQQVQAVIIETHNTVDPTFLEGLMKMATDHIIEAIIFGGSAFVAWVSKKFYNWLSKTRSENKDNALFASFLTRVIEEFPESPETDIKEFAKQLAKREDIKDWVYEKVQDSLRKMGHTNAKDASSVSL